jgi:hypothetical protein
MIKVKSNLDILPLNEMYSKRYLNNRIFNSNSKINKNDMSYNNYAKNKVYITSNNKKKNFDNKNLSKIKENEKNKTKKLNIYKIAQNSITQQYMINNIKKYERIPNSNRAVTISEIKPYTDIKFGRIKVVKKKKSLDSKKKILTDFNKNINININISNSNIYNSNKVSKNNYSNSNIINNIFNNSISINNYFGQKRYKEELNQTFLNSQRNDSHPLLKKLLLSSSNNNIFNSKTKFNMEKMNKSKTNYYNSNNVNSTSRNSQNVSMVHNKINSVGNANKKKSINSHTHKFKKELYSKMKKLLK